MLIGRFHRTEEVWQSLSLRGRCLRSFSGFLLALNPSLDQLELPREPLTFVIIILQKSLTLPRPNAFLTVFRGGSQRAASQPAALLQPLNISSDPGWRPPKLWKFNETNVTCWTALLVLSAKWTHCVQAFNEERKSFLPLVGKKKKKKHSFGISDRHPQQTTAAAGKYFQSYILQILAVW